MDSDDEGKCLKHTDPGSSHDLPEVVLDSLTIEDMTGKATEDACGDSIRSLADCTSKETSNLKNLASELWCKRHN